MIEPPVDVDGPGPFSIAAIEGPPALRQRRHHRRRRHRRSASSTAGLAARLRAAVAARPPLPPGTAGPRQLRQNRRHRRSKWSALVMLNVESWAYRANEPRPPEPGLTPPSFRCIAARRRRPPSLPGSRFADFAAASTAAAVAHCSGAAGSTRQPTYRSPTADRETKPGSHFPLDPGVPPPLPLPPEPPPALVPQPNAPPQPRPPPAPPRSDPARHLDPAVVTARSVPAAPLRCEAGAACQPPPPGELDPPIATVHGLHPVPVWLGTSACVWCLRVPLTQSPSEATGVLSRSDGPGLLGAGTGAGGRAAVDRRSSGPSPWIRPDENARQVRPGHPSTVAVQHQRRGSARHHDPPPGRCRLPRCPTPPSTTVVGDVTLAAVILRSSRRRRAKRSSSCVTHGALRGEVVRVTAGDRDAVGDIKQGWSPGHPDPGAVVGQEH